MFLRRRSLQLLTLSALVASLTGCGNGPLAPASGSTIESLSGVLHGGQSPIQGAIVKLYHTDPTATTYGAPGILIGSGLTDINGNFNIGTSATTTNCPAGDQAYITAAGGYQPGSPTMVNNEMLQMAALGDCAGVTSATFVTINEVTTVAAAYALSGFMTTAMDGTNAYYTANVSAPVANSTTAALISPTAPGGLVHAFLNAAKLVNTSIGQPNTTTSASTAGTTVSGIVPYTEILTLADIMQPCIDSASATSGSVLSIPVTNGGTGYGATVSIAGSGTGAAANATLTGGVVTGLSLVSGGSGYAPTVTIGSGSGAVIAPSLAGGVVTGYTVESEGAGYGPFVTITGTGTGATAVASVSAAGAITGYVITSGGSGYTTGTTATVAPNGTTPTTSAVPGAVTVTGGAVTAIALGTAGAGYAPAVTVSAPTSGTTATATATVTAGAITALTIGTAGSGYGPTITITGPTGSGATATANVMGGAITALNLTAGGTGYPIPTVTVAPPASGVTATATATVVGTAISSITVTYGGSGYTSTPAVTLSAPPSAGTQATAGSTIAGDSGTANVAPSTLCNTLFGFTPSISGVKPVNTLQAFINLARNPYPSAAAMNASTGLLSLASPTSAFQPTLTASPTDWSLAVVYKGSLASPYWLALDANDTVYLGLNTTSTSLPVMYGVGSYGVSVPLFGSPTTGTSARGIAPDALGNVWIDTNSTALFRFNAATGGAPLSTYTTLGSAYGIAVDKANNVWVGNVIASGTNLYEFANTSGVWALNYTASFPGGIYGISVDANQNIWGAPYYDSGASGINTDASVLALAGGASKPYGVVFDASGNAWYDIYGGAALASAGIEEVVPSSTSAAITSITPGAFVTGLTSGPNGTTLGTAVTNLAAIDGAGTMFIPDNTTNTLHIYSTVTGNTLSPSTGIASCYLATTTTTTCGSGSSGAVYNPRQLAVDSTGSVWSGITSGGVTELIGIAAPSYPLLSVGKPGLSPGLTSANPLP